MVTETSLQRLAFIRYLYAIAVEQSRQSEPFGAASVLTFHDSVELFLQLAAETKGINTADLKFMQYWDVLKPHLQNGELRQKEEMRRLNKSRVDLKHIGILPSKLVIEALRANTTSFFEENTPLVFGIEFGKISMTYLIQNTTVRSLLDEATTLIEQGTTGEALNKIAIAFAELKSDFLERKEVWRHRKLFFSKTPFFSAPRLSQADRKFEDFAKQVVASIEALQEGMQVLSLGLDYQRYVQFYLLTPHVVRFVGTFGYQAPPIKYTEDTLPSVERCRFCHNFVVTSAIYLQNLDFEVEP